MEFFYIIINLFVQKHTLSQAFSWHVQVSVGFHGKRALSDTSRVELFLIELNELRMNIDISFQLMDRRYNRFIEKNTCPVTA